MPGNDILSDTNTIGGFPKTDAPPFRSPEDIKLTPEDHFVNELEAIRVGVDSFYTPDPSMHLTRDINDPNLANIPAYHKVIRADGEVVDTPDFSGSTTNINPLNDPDKTELLTTDYETYSKNRGMTKVDPMQPFTRSDPKISHNAMMFSYNRIKIPVADVEWRKGFRHLFFTRPECYVMCNQDGIRLCSQAENDEEFVSTYTRLPHIVQMLAPFYVTGSFENNKTKGLVTNWNYLLSNRVDGFNATGTTIGVNENTGKGYRGHSVTPASFISSSVGGTFEVTFNETKNLECYENLRLWMHYMDKRHSGIFAPSYNGYLYENGFYSPGVITNKGLILHPYDRALDYAATLFDIITNESGTKILYWCKYYGIFPISANPNLSNSNNGPLTNIKTSASFRYMYKVENINRTLIEFNYNAGVVGKTGRLNPAGSNMLTHIQQSLPFLLSDTENDKYIGAAGMFTGSPYIVMGPDYQTNLLNGEPLTVPYLQFASLVNDPINSEMNQNIVNTETNIDLNPIHL